ncbi:MAG: Dabb family protein [Deltaproteobacteria bacterium]|nr:Dabb family protein [Deltaproteobacteria bacterium]
MIYRTVLIKLKEKYATEDKRKEIATYSESLLKSLPGVVRVRVGLPADDKTRADWDLHLSLVFESIDDVEPYRVHPDHRTYVDKYLKPKMDHIRAWNFVEQP